MRALIAGMGNIFESDDGFGSAVLVELAQRVPPPDTEVVDFGIRGVHLAYQLLDGYDLVVIVDAVHRDREPGTVYVIEHEPAPDEPVTGPASMMDAHDMTPDEVLALVPRLGGTLGRVVVVGCEPEVVAPGMDLSEPVARSVEAAAGLALDVVEQARLQPIGGG